MYNRVNAIQLGAAAGLATCIVYPLMIFVPLPMLPTVLLASSMGPLLGVASWGFREFLALEKRTVAADLGAGANAIAGALLTAMLLVQIAVGDRSDDKPGPDAVSIWLGLDVAWDVYIGLGTLLLAIAAVRHSRLGIGIGSAGILIATGLLGLNLYTFPTPPADAGLIDLGPFVGLWYFVVTITILMSLRWVRAVAAEQRS